MSKTIVSPAVETKINELNSNIETYDIGAYSTLASLQSALVTYVATLPTYGFKSIRFSTSPAFDIFQNTSYHGTIRKWSSSRFRVEVTSAMTVRSEILMNYDSGTWTIDENALNSKTEFKDYAGSAASYEAIENGMWRLTGEQANAMTDKPTGFTNRTFVIKGNSSADQNFVMVFNPYTYRTAIKYRYGTWQSWDEIALNSKLTPTSITVTLSSTAEQYFTINTNKSYIMNHVYILSIMLGLKNVATPTSEIELATISVKPDVPIGGTIVYLANTKDVGTFLTSSSNKIFIKMDESITSNSYLIINAIGYVA